MMGSFRLYKNWCYVLVVLNLVTAGLAVYGHRVDPFCRGIEAKYQQLVLHEGPDAIVDVFPSPAEGND